MMLNYGTAWLTAGAVVLAGAFAAPAMADTIDPISFTDDLAVGESVTVRKTVVVTQGTASSALIDVHFLFDTSGSMGSVISGAQAAASDIFTSLSSFGNAAASVGVYSEQALLTGSTPSLVINQDITTNSATAISAINAVTLFDPDGGGDYAENGNAGIKLSVDNLSWRPGSNRFVVVFSDAPYKDGGLDEFGNPIPTNADVMASLSAQNVELIGLEFGTSDHSNSVTALGGTAYNSSTSASAIADAITAGITAGFAEYGSVTVGDLGAGLPQIAVSTACVSAESGSCVGSDAVGSYDRSVDRAFEFDVTFTRVAEGDAIFDTFALVDGGIVAAESDFFPATSAVPLPASAWLLLGGMAGLGALRRRRRAA